MIADEEYYKSLLEKRLNPKRFRHSLCVADEAARLAEKYGGDIEKCRTAGLLHDITKNSPPEEHLQLFSESGIMLSSIEKSAQKLWHAISGAIFLERRLNISDKEILNAVRYHTTARANMTLTDKILYIADFTSLDRDYDDVDIIRKKADESLAAALEYALSYTVRDLAAQYKPIHPDTFEAYNEITLK